MLESIVVCRREFSPEVLEHLKVLTRQEPPPTRNLLAREVCAHLAWYSPDGRPATSSAKVALRPDGVPLGVLDAQCWGREPVVAAARPRGCNAQSIDEKESYRWIQAYQCAAWHRVEWYRQRWEIEEWHRVLKSGCGVEEREFKTAEHLQRVLAFDLIVAWRVLAGVKLGKAMPPLPATVLDTLEEVEVVRAASRKALPPAQELTLDQANRGVARWGGYLDRKQDGPRGAESIGIGLRRLFDITFGWRLATARKS